MLLWKHVMWEKYVREVSVKWEKWLSEQLRVRACRMQQMRGEKRERWKERESEIEETVEMQENEINSTGKNRNIKESRRSPCRFSFPLLFYALCTLRARMYCVYVHARVWLSKCRLRMNTFTRVSFDMRLCHALQMKRVAVNGACV